MYEETVVPSIKMCLIQGWVQLQQTDSLQLQLHTKNQLQLHVPTKFQNNYNYTISNSIIITSRGH